MKERELLAEQRTLRAEIAEREEALRAVDILLSRIRQNNGLGASDFGSDRAVQKRVRGTLKTAKSAVDMFNEKPFTRSGLQSLIEDMNPTLAGKIRPETMRSTIRTLMDHGWIDQLDEVSEKTGEVQYRSKTPLSPE